MNVYWCQSDMDHSSRWVNGSSQGLSCAIVAELFHEESTDGLLDSLTLAAGLNRQHNLFLLSFCVLSNDISAPDLVIKADCCEMTICNSKLIISLYYWAESTLSWHEHEKNKRVPTLGLQVSNFTLLSAAYIFSVWLSFLPQKLLLITVCDVTSWLRNTILLYLMCQQY